MRKSNWVIWVLLILTVSGIVWHPLANPTIRQWFTGNSGKTTDASTVLEENHQLSAKLAILEHLSDILPTASSSSVRALVYSEYPFNLTDEWTLSAGSAEGVGVGSAAVLPSVSTSSNAPQILIGKIKSIFSQFSVAQTIFDPSWKSAVKIGPNGVDALLTGGTEPRLTLIPKSASVTPGMSVYSTAKDLPYGLAIGEVGEVDPSLDGLFWEASLNLAYDPNNVDAVLLLNGNAH